MFDQKSFEQQLPGLPLWLWVCSYLAS